MKTVWKYNLGLRVKNAIVMPPDTHVLRVSEQFGNVCMWALVDIDAQYDPVPRTFVTVGTGQAEVPDGARYIGTAHLEGGALVLHVFETTPRPQITLTPAAEAFAQLENTK